MKHRSLSCLLALAAAWTTSPALRAAEAPRDDAFLFTSFRGNGEDGLHLALSHDGFRWTPLQGDRSWLRSEIGMKLMRDPCLAAGPDGTFHLVWTTGWTAESGRVIGYARSRDLVHWSAPRGIEVMQTEPKTRNVWAPELFFDATNAHWLIFWSSTIPGRFAETEATGDDGYNHRIYFTVTKDFEVFTDSKLLYDPGFNCIDATLLKADDTLYLVFKDERKNPLKKDLRFATARVAAGPFSAPSEPFTGNWVEGPSAIRIDGWVYVYFDHYASPHYYGAVRTQDFKFWEDVSPRMTFPRDHRHGTVLRIPGRLAAGLAAGPN